MSAQRRKSSYALRSRRLFDDGEGLTPLRGHAGIDVDGDTFEPTGGLGLAAEPGVGIESTGGFGLTAEPGVESDDTAAVEGTGVDESLMEDFEGLLTEKGIHMSDLEDVLSREMIIKTAKTMSLMWALSGSDDQLSNRVKADGTERGDEVSDEVLVENERMELAASGLYY